MARARLARRAFAGLAVLALEVVAGAPALEAGFATAVNYATGTRPIDVAVGDFNQDGSQDLAVADFYSNSVSILLGNGDGTFQAAVQYAVGTRPVYVAIGDFNTDGNQDLAVANSHLTGTLGRGDLSILLGNGNGTFQAAVNYGAGENPTSIAARDLNGDGKEDLAVANFGTGTGPGDVSILLGNGDGTFQTAVSHEVGDEGPNSVAVGDFNWDGKPDLAVAIGAFNEVSILLGNGNGTFQAPVNYGVGTSPNAVAVGDLNRDGKADLAVANFWSSDVSILLGNGNGTFRPAVNYGEDSPPGYPPRLRVAVAIADFNGDGKQDLAVANDPSHDISIFLGNGDGTFQAEVTYGAGSYTFDVAVGDFNQDGKPDLAVANGGSDNVSVLLNDAPTINPADLSITKTDGQASALPGSPVTYTIVVSNAGPNAATGATVKDTLPWAVTGAAWTCVGAGGGTCASSGSGSINDTVNLPVGASGIYTLTGTIAVTATGVLRNTASVVPEGFSDSNAANNSATDTDTLTPLPPAFAISDAIVTEGDSGAMTASVTVTLSAASGVTASVNYATSDRTAVAGSDYVGASGSLVFSPGTRTRTIDILVRGDTIDEPNEAFVVDLSGPVNATISRSRGQVAIRDDDGRVSLCVPIVTLPFTIAAQGSYCLTRNLSAPVGSGGAITIDSDFVVLDLGGFKIGGGAGGPGTHASGVHALNRKNITIKDGTIRGFFRGIFLEDSSPGFIASQGHLVQAVRADENTYVGIQVQGRGSVVRNNQVSMTTGTTVFGANAHTYGIWMSGPAVRILNNDVTDTVPMGSSFGLATAVDHASGAVIEKNRISNSSPASSYGVKAVSGADVMVIGNRIALAGFGVYYDNATGKYSHNLTTGMATPYSGGSDGGGNN